MICGRKIRTADYASTSLIRPTGVVFEFDPVYLVTMLNNDFHESTVLEFDFLKNELVIEILSEPDGTLKTTLVFTGVEEIVVDGEVSSDSLGMIYPDGEVLSITENSNTVSIYIIWNDFKTQSSLTKSYEFNCQSITMDRRHYDESVS